MTDEAVMKAFAQSVTLAMTGKQMDADDLDSEDGDQFILELVDWTNQFVDEIELETDWNSVTELDKEIGIVASAIQTFPLPVGSRKLGVHEHRPLRILQDGTAVSTWDVVRPAMISARRDGYPLNSRVTFVGKNIVFSRDLNDNELGGTVLADVVNKMPRLAYTKGVEGTPNDLSILELVEPRQLLVLGVAKNATLPNFVRGKISPSLVQKYADVLGKAVAENEATGTGDVYESEDMNYGGVY